MGHHRRFPSIPSEVRRDHSNLGSTELNPIRAQQIQSYRIEVQQSQEPGQMDADEEEETVQEQQGETEHEKSNPFVLTDQNERKKEDDTDVKQDKEKENNEEEQVGSIRVSTSKSSKHRRMAMQFGPEMVELSKPALEPEET